ncbi:ornithine cyclodeaminase family protein [Pseudorhodoferax sp.]|uniref:ornithine cyclodeaminase family protein n=1 Tax=Pseudorhodoferax sp. TaxID=1993553 RepID=UPI002DD6ADE8|nr:ornithine cyclodeaminase family protein [Pseudorhodoferax sp.]
MRIVDAEAVHAALPFARLVETLRAAFAAPCTVPLRHTHQVDGITSLIMPAWTQQHYGVKVINIAPGNAARGLPGLHASYLLHDAATGVPLALLDGDAITARRTVAASALAASYLARGDAQHLLVVGAGRLARLLPAAFAAVRPITRVTVWARQAVQAQALAAQLAADGFMAQAAPDLAAACATADIVSCATLATAPVVQGRWLAPGSHLDLIGSFAPTMVEADDACFAGAALYIDTPEALQKSGDLLGPLGRGVFGAADVRGTLAQLVTGQAPGRSAPDQRTVFKAVGTALEDLAAAVAVLDTLPARR